MTPDEIEFIITTVVNLAAFVVGQIGKSENLTDDQKQAYINRIKAAQAAVPEWK